jgi:hypothetical protein
MFFPTYEMPFIQTITSANALVARLIVVIKASNSLMFLSILKNPFARSPAFETKLFFTF